MPVQWYENTAESVGEALRKQFGDRTYLVLTASDQCVYKVCAPLDSNGMPMGDDHYYLAKYSTDAAGAVTFEQPQEVSEAPRSFQTADGATLADSISLVYSTPGASGSMGNGKAPPAFVQKMGTTQRHQWVDVWNSEWTACKKKGGSDSDCEVRAFKAANGVVKADDSIALAEKTTSKPWDGSASRFKDTAAYCASCLIDDNAPGAAKVQGKCHLPIKEPDGTVNLNAVRNARSRISQLSGVSAASKAAAQKRLDALAKQHLPSSSVAADDSTALADATPVDWYEQVDASNATAIRLSDTATLPAWQQIHRIGKWVVPHGVSGPIEFTRAMGDSFIANFKRNVIRRRVPFDERHLTEQNGVALAWLEELRWGKEGEGLPDAPEPSGRGDILYGRWDYNQLGQQKLTDRQYLYGSPQYALDWVEKESGKHYGPTLLAYAGTNDPFLRLRDFQGNPAAPVAAHDLVILTDGLKPYVPTQEAPMPTEEQNPQGQQAPPASESAEERLARLERELAEQRAAFTASEQARQASEAQLADERRTRYLADVDTYVDGLTRQGVPPGATAKFRTLLKRMNPSAQAVITLSDEQGAPTLTLADAIRECMSEMPAIALHARTFQTDTRPREQVSLDDQIDKMDPGIFNAEAASMWAHRLPRNGANGAATH